MKGVFNNATVNEVQSRMFHVVSAAATIVEVEPRSYSILHSIQPSGSGDALAYQLVDWYATDISPSSWV